MYYFLILVSVCLSAFSQIVLRYGMTRPAILNAMSSGAGGLEIIAVVVRSPYVMLGLGVYGLGALIWLLVLSKIPVSFAYPFVSLGIVLTTVIGVLVLNEKISAVSAVGVLLIVAGISLVAVGRS